MGLVFKASFSTGELDPALWERTNLDKFKNGLATARNVVVSKTGSLLSRPGRSNFKSTKLVNSKCKLYSPPGSGYLLEWGHQYVRIYAMVDLAFIAAGTLISDVAHALTESDLPSIHFETSKGYVYIMVQGKQILKLNYVTGVFASGTNYFSIPVAPTAGVVAPAGTPTGYFVDYWVTYVINGEESDGLFISGASTYKLPIAAGQENVISAQVSPTSLAGITEMRVYRRPQAAGAFGFIGSTSAFSVPSGTLQVGAFKDYGQSADYSHIPPQPITNSATNGSWLPKTGTIYQQRLILNDTGDLEGILASRPGFQNDFYQNYPIDSGSALKFKSASAGNAQVLRMIDSDGLVVFTTFGVFLHSGELTPDNLSIPKKGKWIIDASVAPLAIPGGVFFVDASTKAIRSLNWQYQAGVFRYVASDLSVYSNHLFYNKVVTSMAFHEGAIPILWATFDDGTFASFTYDFDQQMQAWTRHDSSEIQVEQVAATGVPDVTAFLVNKNGNRYIELTNARYATKTDLVTNPEYDKSKVIAAMDSIVTYDGLLNTKFTNDDAFEIYPVGQDIWDGDLVVRCNNALIFSVAPFNQVPGSSYVKVGDIIRYFDPSDGSTYDLKVKSITNGQSAVVTPYTEFPSNSANGPRLYWTASTFTGLDHMEGESVAVIADGNLVASPNNDIDNFEDLMVTNGSLTLPSGMLGAIVHIGRPITYDTETLDIDTVEQAPTLIESLNVGKLYVKTRNSRGLYVGNKFPDDDKIGGMQALDEYTVDYSKDFPITGNIYKQPQTIRREVTLPGDWASNGHVAIRQVDPLHFEILSIIPDVEVLTRSDR